LALPLSLFPLPLSPLLGITLYMVLQFGIGIWVSRRIHTESDYILAGRRLGYVLTTFSIFATWFGAETIVGSAGRAYREGVSLGSAEPFGYGLCLVLMGLIFAVPLWRRQLTTLADLYRVRFSPAAERLAAIILIPGSVLWAAAQIRAFGNVLAMSGDSLNVETALAIAAGFTILYTVFGGMLADAITDVIQGLFLVAGLVILLIAVLPHLGAGPNQIAIDPGRVQILPEGESLLPLLERWAIPIAGSVIATELVGRVLAARSGMVARRASLMAGAMYLGVGVIPLFIGVIGPQIAPNLADGEQLLPYVARNLLPTALYVVFAGALISAILSTVDSTLLVSSSLLSHNIVNPMLRITDERAKLLIARAGVVTFGVGAYFFARSAEGVFALVEEASSFGSSGALVTVTFGLFTSWGGARTAIATLVTGVVSYLAATITGSATPFLLSLLLSLTCYLAGAAIERRPARV
jgi:Na+/proline symporter